MGGWTSLLTGKPFDQQAMGWEQLKETVARRQIKVREVEAWRDRATAERVSRAQRHGCLKHPRRDHRLRNIAAGQVGAQSDRTSSCSVKYVELERISCVEVPHFVRAENPVASRKGAGRQ